MLHRLCIGTAQFGFDYGVTNLKGKVEKEEVYKILETAKKYNICFLDTSQNYFEAEKVLGSNIPENSNFRIINKLKILDEKLTCKEFMEKLENEFHLSLKKLNVSSLDSFLVHNINNFVGKRGEILITWLVSLKERKLVKRIGASIYTCADLDKLPLEKLQIIQLPLSIYDQRNLLNGTIQKLKDNGIAVHVRSVFLQGIILQPPHKLPEFLSSRFRLHHQEFYKLFNKDHRLILEQALSLPFICDEIEAVVLGFSNLYELNQIISIISDKNFLKNKKIDDFKKFNWVSEKDIDPRLWMM